MRVEVLTALAPAGLLLCDAGGLRPGGAREEPVDYRREVQPLLDQRCRCGRGPEEQESGSRLDSRAAALAGSRHGEHPVMRSGAESEPQLCTGSALGWTR